MRISVLQIVKLIRITFLGYQTVCRMEVLPEQVPLKHRKETRKEKLLVKRRRKIMKLKNWPMPYQV